MTAEEEPKEARVDSTISSAQAGSAHVEVSGPGLKRAVPPTFPPPSGSNPGSFDRSHRQPTKSSERSWPGVRSPPSLAWGPLRKQPRRPGRSQEFILPVLLRPLHMHSKGIKFIGRNGRLKNLSSQICIVTITHGDREIYSQRWRTMCY